MENQRCENTSYVRGNCSPSDYPPHDYEHLLLCNGQTINADDYPELVVALGTNVLPNLNGRVLQGAETAGEYKEAGLPNITGALSTYNDSILSLFNNVTGCFKRDKPKDSSLTYDNLPKNTSQYAADYCKGGIFDASKSNAIYGKSTTVQPPAYTVRYYICYG